LNYNDIVERNISMSYHNPVNINPRHKRLAQLIVGGYSQSQCAKLFDVDKSTISRWMKTPSVLAEIERLQDIADVNVVRSVPGMTEKLQEGAHKGIEALIEILEDKRNDPEIMRLKSNAAVEILDRAGYGPIKHVNVQQASISTHLTAEEIEEFKQRGMKALQSANLNLDGQDNQ
jgi:phage terminase small subunit